MDDVIHDDIIAILAARELGRQFPPFVVFNVAASLGSQTDAEAPRVADARGLHVLNLATKRCQTEHGYPLFQALKWRMLAKGKPRTAWEMTS